MGLVATECVQQAQQQQQRTTASNQPTNLRNQQLLLYKPYLAPPRPFNNYRSGDNDCTYIQKVWRHMQLLSLLLAERLGRGVGVCDGTNGWVTKGGIDLPVSGIDLGSRERSHGFFRFACFFFFCGSRKALEKRKKIRASLPSPPPPPPPPGITAVWSDTGAGDCCSYR